jgi:hypothetical protein
MESYIIANRTYKGDFAMKIDSTRTSWSGSSAG